MKITIEKHGESVSNIIDFSRANIEIRRQERFDKYKKILQAHEADEEPLEMIETNEH